MSRSASLLSRASGVLAAPRATFEAVADERRWAGLLVVTTVVIIASNALVLQTEVGRLALLDRLERMALAFGQHVDDTRYAELDRMSTQGPAYAAATGLLEGPALTVAAAALIYVCYTSFGRGKASMPQILAVVAHAGVILALREVVAAPISYAYETLASPTTLTRFFPMLDEASPVARFLGVIDLFVVWWVIWLAIGVSVLYQRPVRQLIGRFIGGYVAVAVLLALVMALAGGTA